MQAGYLILMLVKNADFCKYILYLFIYLFFCKKMLSLPLIF